MAGLRHPASAAFSAAAAQADEALSAWEQQLRSAQEKLDADRAAFEEDVEKTCVFRSPR